MKKLNSLTRLRAEELSKKNKAEELDRLSAIGQENEIKGAKWAIEDYKEKEKLEVDHKLLTYDLLNKLKRNKKLYQRFLIKLIKRFIKDEDLPHKYKFIIDSTDKGISVQIEGTNLYTAFSPVGIEKFDFSACKTVALKLGNTIAHLEGQRDSQNGILLPNTLDKKYAIKSTRRNHK